MRVSGSVFVRERKRGAQWYAKWRIDGRQHKKTRSRMDRAREAPSQLLHQAPSQEALDAILTDARRGERFDAVGRSHTYREAWDEWLRYVEDERGRAPSTVRDYRNTIERRLKPAFRADKPVASITTEDVDALHESLLAEGKLSRRSVQKILVLNYGILKRAKRRKWIPANPAEDAERVTLKRSGDFNVLSPEEVHAVARVADDAQDAALFAVAAFTGLCMGELRALRWTDVDFGNRNVLVRGNFTRGRLAAPKSGKVRSIPLIDQAAKALDGLSQRDHFTEPGDLVFPSDTGTYFDDGDVRKRFYAALKRAGLGHKRTEQPPMRFHDLRHTFGTLAVQVWPLHDVQAYMGHANVQTTMLYAHHVPKHGAADALTQLVAGQSEDSDSIPNSLSTAERTSSSP